MVYMHGIGADTVQPDAVTRKTLGGYFKYNELCGLAGASAGQDHGRLQNAWQPGGYACPPSFLAG
jgi:hypothetical protein